MAKANVALGYRRIQGALKALGHSVAHNTVKKAPKGSTIAPVSERLMKTTWAQFLRADREALAATDLFTTEVWSSRGLVTFHTLCVIELRTRRVHVVGSTPHPDTLLMSQAALELV